MTTDNTETTTENGFAASGAAEAPTDTSPATDASSEGAGFDGGSPPEGPAAAGSGGGAPGPLTEEFNAVASERYTRTEFNQAASEGYPYDGATQGDAGSDAQDETDNANDETGATDQAQASHDLEPGSSGTKSSVEETTDEEYKSFADEIDAQDAPLAPNSNRFSRFEDQQEGPAKDNDLNSDQAGPKPNNPGMSL